MEPTQKKTPDSDTIERIRNLAFVGSAINQTASETNFLTDFFVAKEALNKFKVDMDKLELDEVSRKGMNSLIDYLQRKIDKRIKFAESTGDTPMI